MTTTIKIYSQHKPLKINGHYPLTVETYNITNGVKSNSVWYSEVSTDHYFNTRTELEKEGYTAHPASYKEINSQLYTIFKETVIPL
jgi:hypothetical protein